MTPARGGSAAEPVGVAFLAQSRAYLIDSFWPRLGVALERMPEADLWWRPNEASNSVGNIVLHLCGNARQWIVSGVGGAPDVRRRQEEFDERGPLLRAQLVGVLNATFGEIDRTLAGLDPAALLERRVIQGREVTLLGAILHVVEHVSHHTGQILWIAKARTGRDLGLWTVRDGVATPTWNERP
ncbi:MAG: DUF1572 domain-containing protein [Gemmatimonadetes bacterium]|nr:DUF1572 domain-containing protein [Gemmatimonadota bacterium]